MNRRLFLGIVGGTIAAAATPEMFSALVKAPAPSVAVVWNRRLVMELFFSCVETGIYTVRRAGSEIDLFHPMWMNAGGMYRWVAVPDFEIVLVPNQPTLVIDGPRVDQWFMIWSEQKHDGLHRYSSGSTYSEPIALTINDMPVDVDRWLTDRDHTTDEDWPFAPDDYDEAGD